MSLTLSRLGGLNSSLAIKAPVRVASTTNLSLLGFQTIDGVTLAEADFNLRVLVKNQTDTSQNGIWKANAGAWTRDADWNAVNDFVKGTTVRVQDGTVGQGEYIVTSDVDADFVIDEDGISFAGIFTGVLSDLVTLALMDDTADYLAAYDTSASVWTKVLGQNLGFTQGGSGATLRSLQGKLRERVTPQDFGSGFNSADINQALAYLNTLGGGVCYCPTGTYTLTASLTMYPHTQLEGDGFGGTIFSRSTDYGNTLNIGTVGASGGAQSVQVSGIWFLSTGSWTGSPKHIALNHAQDAEIDWCWFWGLDGQVLVDGGTKINLHDNQFGASGPVGSYSVKIIEESSVGGITTGVYLNDNYFAASGYAKAIHVTQAEVLNITGGYIGGYAQNSIYFNPGAGTPIISGVRISVPFLDPCSTAGKTIEFVYGSTYTTGVTIEGCNFYGADGPINHILANFTGANWSVANLIVSGNTFRDSSRASMKFLGAVGFNVSNNTFLNYNDLGGSLVDPDHAAGIYVLGGGASGVSRDGIIGNNYFGATDTTIFTPAGDANNNAVWGVYLAGTGTTSRIELIGNRGRLRTGGSLIGGDVTSQQTLSESTDNMVPRADGITGNLQSSALGVDDSGNASTTGAFQSLISGSPGSLQARRTDAHGNDQLVGNVLFQGKDSAGNVDTFAQMQGYARDATSTSEDGVLLWGVAIAGAMTTKLHLEGSALMPSASDGTALGNTSQMWSDLFLASGGVVNFNNGDVTITHSSDLLAFAGGTYTFDGAVKPASNDGAALGTTALQWADLFLAAGGVINWANGGITLTEASDILLHAGAASYKFDAGVLPTSSDGAALGSTALMWSDLFLASGAVINFNNGNYTITHAAGDLGFSGIVTLPNTGLHILDTNASHDLIVVPGSNITADRTFTITTGDADRTLDLGAWTSYTPTVSAQTGTITTSSATGAWARSGQTIFYWMNIVVTTNGTGATALIGTLPVAASATNRFTFLGRNNTTGASILGYMISGTSNLFMQTVAAAAYPIADGQNISIAGSYEAA